MADRNDFDDFFGDDEQAPVADTRADGRLYRVPLTRLAANLVNPRTDFGTEDQLIDLGKSLARRQNQPCPVVSRSAYLKLWPDHKDSVGDVDYVLVSGERRYRGATAVGLPALNVVVNDDFATDRKTFLEAVVSENVDRQNFDPIEEAYAVQALVAEFGTGRAVAQHFQRADGWVTQRVLLTHLCREVQDLVRAKAMPLDAARDLGKRARDNAWSVRDQLEWWEAEQERRAAVAAAKSAARRAARPPAPAGHPSGPVEDAPPAAPAAASFTAVKPDPAPAPQQETADAPAHEEQPAVRPPHPAPVETPLTQPSATVPDPRTSHTEPEDEAVPERRQVKMPWHDGVACAEIAISKMDPRERVRMVEKMLEHQLAQNERRDATARAS